MRRPHLGLVPPVAVAAALTAAAALTTPHGLPYDEPAHWTNVEFYVERGRLPEIGEEGSSYESQMGPLYYLLAAALLRATGATGDQGITTVRLLGVLLAVALVVVTWQLARRCDLADVDAAWAAALVAASPLMAGVGGSVQNDQLTVLLAGATLLVTLPLLHGSGRDLGRSALVGVLAGLAVLTKLPGMVLVPAVIAAVLLVYPTSRTRQDRWWSSAAICLTAGLVSGWWFVRNLLVHGDLTGAAAVEATGVSFPPLRLSGLATLTGQLVSYPFAPVEYTRNVVNAPALVELTAAALFLLTVGTLAAGLVAVTRAGQWRDGRVLLLGGTVILTLAGYLGYVVLLWATPPRLLAQCAPALAVAVVAAAARSRSRPVVWGVVVGELGCAVWLLFATNAYVPG